MKFWRTPLDIDKLKIPRGELHIIKERCKGCGFCVEYCPNEVLKLAERFNAKGYHPPEVINPDDCVDCGFCRMICPEFAIYSVEIKEEETLNSKS